MKILIFIPARSGSKGIKNKNITKLNGKPLINYTLSFARKLTKEKNFSVFLSTDSKKYLKYSSKKDLNYNYLRPKNISGDNSRIIDAVLHGLDWLATKNLYFDAVLLLQPTSPLRKTSETRKAINFFKKKKINSLVSVTKMKEHPFECIKSHGKKWEYLEKNKVKITKRQNYPNKYFFIDGSIYLSKVSFLKKYNSFVVKNKTKLFKLTQFPSIDIDQPVDLKISKLFL